MKDPLGYREENKYRIDDTDTGVSRKHTIQEVVDHVKKAAAQPILQLDRLKYSLQKQIFDHTTAQVFIAGGYITKKLSGETPNDIDFFFSSRTHIARFLLDIRKNLKFKSRYVGKNLIRGTIELYGKRMKVDLVKRLFKSEQDVIDNFDFTICCFCISKDSYVYHKDAPFDLLQKKLNINHILYPAATLMRLQKYVKRDFTYCKGVVRDIMTRCKEEDVLVEDQFFYEDGVLQFDNLD